MLARKQAAYAQIAIAKRLDGVQTVRVIGMRYLSLLHVPGANDCKELCHNVENICQIYVEKIVTRQGN